MTGPILPQPHDMFLKMAESMAMRAFETEGREGLCGLCDWLASADRALPLHRVASGFALEPAEIELLALLFAAALSEDVSRRLAADTQTMGRGLPFWLARRLIPHLRADNLSAGGALRRFGLVEVEPNALRIEALIWLNEAVVDRFSGAATIDADISPFMSSCAINPDLASALVSEQCANMLAVRGLDGLSPAIIAGPIERGVLAASLRELGLVPWQIAAQDIPSDPVQRDRMARMWSRDAALDGAALIITCDEMGLHSASELADKIAGHVIISGVISTPPLRRSIRVLNDAHSRASNPMVRWTQALGPARAAKLGRNLARVAAQFQLSPAEIDATCDQSAIAIDAAADMESAGQLLWHCAGRAAILPPVSGVAIVDPNYTWADIIVAPPIESALKRIEAHVTHATKVFDEWGFSRAMGGRGRGVAVLFSGPSGTGKTMAAEVLASSLDLRMMMIDLSQIISKYVGETSKNIAAAFEQAERTGAVMVWNEGDAIWGARGAVGNATDRHANAEIGDLLQRIEAFRGFTIVTTNMRHAIDPAFLRRFRFTIDFPMPAECERLRLWQNAFPPSAPIGPMDWTPLARLPLSGGAIRSVALGSAFLAAEGGGPIDKDSIVAELTEELRKQNLLMPHIEWGPMQ